MKIAMAQLGPTTGDLEGNARDVTRAICRARERNCDLLVTPETCITGYMSCDLLEVDAYVRANRELLMRQIVPATKGIAAVVGFVDYESEGGRIVQRYNAAAIIQDGELVDVAHKRCLCRYRFFDETRYYEPGDRTVVQPLELGGVTLRVATIICEDLWDETYPACPYADAAAAGADLVVVLNASPFETGKWHHRVQLIRSHQEQHRLPIVYTNTTGVGDNLKGLILFDGRSMVFDSRGRLAGCGPFFQQGLSVVELDENLAGSPPVTPSWNEEEELHNALTFALREYCRDTGFERVVLGMSGGVDSSLCAALAAKSLGPDRVLGVTLPSRHSSSDTRTDAERSCQNLGIDFAEIPIEDLYSCTLDNFTNWKQIERNVTRENFQARLRGLLLMGISNETGRMVIATGNKTELGLGYCTLYGDMVGGMLLIGDVNKVQVYHLAQYINSKSGEELIPESVLTRPPTAELAEEQKDPFDYSVVAPVVDDLIARWDAETLMEHFRRHELRNHYPADLYERYDEESFEELLKDTYHRYRQSAFKRSQASPIVIVSDRALGFDLRETIINWWHQGLQ
jgi:NAD+ synthase (glutamine-hydrolysing)